jgi:hypothetical protein
MGGVVRNHDNLQGGQIWWGGRVPGVAGFYVPQLKLGWYLGW